MPSPTRLAMLRQAFWLALVPGGLLFLVMQVSVHVTHGMVGADSHAYWNAARHPENWYTTPAEYRDAFLYSPLFAQLLWPLARLPWEIFQLVWAGAQVAVLAWLLKPLGWRRALTVAPFFVAELLLGNIYLFLAAALVLAVIRTPGALLVPLLTKVTPGVVGLWFALRGDWRYVRSTGLLLVGSVLASAAIDPSAWSRWIKFLVTSADSGPGFPWMLVRFAAAFVLVLVAARRGWAWLLAPALILACPVLSAFSPWTVLGAVPRLLEWQRTRSASVGRDHDPSPVAREDSPTRVAP